MSANVLRDLRGLRVLVVHSPDDEGRSLVEHLRRIGCIVEPVWPIPESLSWHADVIMLAIEFQERETIRRLLRNQIDGVAALIAIVDYENPSTLQLVLESGALAVVEKPIRPFGLLTNLMLARALWIERRERDKRLRKVEAKLSGLQKIQRAKTILMQSQQLTEDEAYATLRKQAMAKRIALEEMAAAIIHAHELLTMKSPSR